MSVTRQTQHLGPIVRCMGRWSLFAALIALPVNCWAQPGWTNLTFRSKTAPVWPSAAPAPNDILRCDGKEVVEPQEPPPNPKTEILMRVHENDGGPGQPAPEPPGGPAPRMRPPLAPSTIEPISEDRPLLIPRPAPVELPPLEVPPLDGPLPSRCPVCYQMRCGVHCNNGPGRCPLLNRYTMYPIPWEAFAQGEYVGPARLPHVPEYRLRVDDQLDFVYIFSVRPSARPYRLSVRDRIHIESLTAPDINLSAFVQPDGMITLPLLGQLRVVGLTLDELQQKLEDNYQKFVRKPAITVTPVELNSPLLELRAAVDRRAGAGGQVSPARVTPEGTVQLPVIGSVAVQGLSLPEVKREIELRYEAVAEGIEVTPILSARAPRFFFVVGEVRQPGRFVMEGPTTAVQAIAMAGSWNVGAYLEHVVVLRRDENWCLMATKLNLRPQLHGNKPCNGDEIWLRDSDVVIVPKNALLKADDFVDLLFTRGIYRVLPFSTTLNFSGSSTL